MLRSWWANRPQPAFQQLELESLPRFPYYPAPSVLAAFGPHFCLATLTYPFPAFPLMLDFDVQRCTRRCSGSDRELKAGEWVYSALVPRGAQVLRLDFSPDVWKGPPENAIGWWKGRVPEGGNQRTAWAPNDVMLDYFEHLETRPDKADVRYVLALLLVRRRVIRLENTLTDDEGNETLVVFCPRNEQESRVVAILPDDQRVAEIQTELSTLLFGDSSSLMPPPAEPTVEPLAESLAEPHGQSSDDSARESSPPTNSESSANSGLKVVGLEEQSEDEESAEAEADETSLAGALADETEAVEADSDEADEDEEDEEAEEDDEDEENDDGEGDEEDEQVEDEFDEDEDAEDENEDDEEEDDEEVDEEEDEDELDDDEDDDEEDELDDADADESDDSAEEPGESS